MSVSGVINTHFIVAYMIIQHGDEEQKQRFLPRMAAGEVRGAFSMSEPGLGSDVAGIRTKATKQADGNYVIDGQKMWLTNGGASPLLAGLGRPPEGGGEGHPKPTTLPLQKPPRLRGGQPGVPPPPEIRKNGYKGVD